MNKCYGDGSAKSVRAKFDEVAADVQIFRESLRMINASNPTGITEDEKLSMAIAKNLGKRTSMSYYARTIRMIAGKTTWHSKRSVRDLNSQMKVLTMVASRQKSKNLGHCLNPTPKRKTDSHIKHPLHLTLTTAVCHKEKILLLTPLPLRIQQIELCVALLVR